MCVWYVYTCVRACVSVLVHMWVFKLNTSICACATSSLRTGPPDPPLTFLTLHVLENNQNFQNCCQVNTGIMITGVRNQGASLHPPPSSLGPPKSLKVSVKLSTSLSVHLSTWSVLLPRHLGRCLLVRVACLMILIQSLALPSKG